MLHVEIRWKGPLPTSDAILFQLESVSTADKVDWHASEYDDGYTQAIGCNVATWGVFHLKHEDKLLAEIHELVVGRRITDDRPTVFIEGLTLGDWLNDLEMRFVVLRADAMRAARGLKDTRRFFRDKRVEAVRKQLEESLQDFGGKEAMAAPTTERVSV